MKTYFAYALSGAWHEPILSVRVTDEAEGSVICRKYEADRFGIPAPVEERFSVSKDVIDKITAAVKRNPLVLTGSEIDFPPVLDGTVSDFFFCDGVNENIISGYNVWYWEQTPPRGKRTKAVLAAFREIRDVLLDAGVEEEYLRMER